VVLDLIKLRKSFKNGQIGHYPEVMCKVNELADKLKLLNVHTMESNYEL